MDNNTFLIEEDLTTFHNDNTKEAEWASYKLYFNGKEVFSVKHDNKELDKNTLFDNFKDCINIPALLKTVYELGKENKEIKFAIK